MAFLSEIPGDRMLPLRDHTLLGRDPACDIIIPSSGASRRHARVAATEAGFEIEDLGSVNGTFVNGEAVTRPTLLHPADRVEIAGQLFIFHEAGGLDGLPATELDEEGSGRRSAIMSSLDVTGGVRVEIGAEAKLRAVLEMTKNLGTTLDLEALLPKILESLFTIFPQADRGIILLRDGASGRLAPEAVRYREGKNNDELPISQTIINHAVTTGRAVLSADAGSDERFDPSTSIGRLHIRSVMCVPMLGRDRSCLGVIQVDAGGKWNQFAEADLDVLVSASLLAARAVELARLHVERRDLETATQIQKSFLPRERPRVEQLQFYEYYAAAERIGGDYYDYIPLPGRRLGVALGDVSGKGISAALLMARLSAAVRFCLASEPSVPSAIRQLNLLLERCGSEGHFVTFVAAVLNLDTFDLTLVNAAHPAPLRRRAGQAAVEEIGDGIIGLPLGVFDRPYQEVTLPLEPGDTVVLFTDGVTEARNLQRDMYGPERLRAVIAEAPAGAEAVGRAILEDVKRFVAGAAPSDDLTIVCFGRT